MKADKKKTPVVEGVEFAKAVARIAEEHRAEDVVVLDLRGLTSIADYFVIGTGTSDRQTRAVIDRIDAHCHEIGQKRFGLCGYDTATWVLADYVDVVVHMFDAEHRRYYDLELLWGDAPRVEWENGKA
ncbi:MAG: ribosome silencing factor [Phycisphaerales bacterium]|nr:ribosome silencing factor [Phycisphaerales bacterium]